MYSWSKSRMKKTLHLESSGKAKCSYVHWVQNKDEKKTLFTRVLETAKCNYVQWVQGKDIKKDLVLEISGNCKMQLYTLGPSQV